jgi:hypothetical protein
MATKWKSGGLNNQVETGMGRVADLLEDGDVHAAQKVQLALMVDWPSHCSPWGIGIKHLIASAKEQDDATKEQKGGISTPLD